MEEVNPKTKNISAGPADFMANERTFLAWIRTSIALMGFGFVIVKFALFVKQMAMIMGGKGVPPGKGYSAEIGTFMVVLGALMTVLSYIRYRHVDRQLGNNVYFPSKWLSLLVAGVLVVGAILLVFYLLPSVRQ
ncbi:YidH family protein [Mucilaginibacter auburnensis]|uniref:Putative membrane protein n=1 Tax=Mucilaginibacter auburnensis TaxID=1457233 RepID=A0A2H9VQL4_9SPHI|nr:DUF202 domain-containing protein [Mucilaginibacter auburnensis]PJJ83109.1 putative membrane protein [Mucilaginibacter auburnensis]